VRRSTKVRAVTATVVFGVCAVAGRLFMTRYPTAVWPESPVVAASRGSLLPNPRGYKWEANQRTLLLALHVGCPYCDSSMGFYERLSALERSRAIRAHVLAAFPEPAAEIRRTLAGRLSGVQTLERVDLRALRVVGTPTVMLVDSQGQVLSVWIGQLSSSEQAALAAAAAMQ